MWILLAASLACLGFKKSIGFTGVLLTIAGAAWSGVLALPGLLLICVIALLILLLHYYRHIKALARSCELLLVGAAIALFTHVLPGFNHSEVVNNIRVGEQSAAFSLYFNFDKALLPFILVAVLPGIFRTKPVRTLASVSWFVLALTVPGLLLLAVLLGGLKVEIHHPAWLWQFVLANLFFVSLAEEALFRGYLQQRLSQFMGPIPALFTGALLFGFCHMAGGILLVIFAGLAGITYGLAWMYSGRLWVATLFHFALNTIHLLFFTYPAYQPA